MSKIATLSQGTHTLKLIDCELLSAGLTPEQLIAAVEAKGRKVWDYARGIMLGKGQDPFPEVTTGVTSRLGVIFGAEFKDGQRTNGKIFAEMAKRGLGKPHPEVAAMLRERFSQEELLRAVNALRPAGTPEVTWVIVMHDPLRDSVGRPSLLGLDRGGGGDVVGACYGCPDYEWVAGYAFVVLLPQEDSVPQA